MDTTLNNKVALAMLDIGATKNVMDPKEAKRLGLRITRRSDTEIKIINGKPMMNIRWAWDVKIRIGGCQGELDFLIAPLNDCKIILGLDFIDRAYATINLFKKTLGFSRIRREVPLKRMGAT
ncbi:Asp_protease domain-containing protein [Cucumis melo var. makuwa]|uniref:Asp_protease domain-containing protein n=1 Tax=Cucumis melo var. makuwa TaxID=1194695 RepID=A0A5D3E2A4_CUCMM|nr:Asp_protease domain-containing protein [Cucumis melo var. makuwa]